MTFEALGLMPILCDTVKELGYNTPTVIQRKAVPMILSGQDLIAIAQTGTGKTAAFTLPLLQNLLKAPRTQPLLPRALVLTPTRELALQVFEDLANYGKGSGITSVLLHGGVSYGPQFEKMEAGIDIIVATPGRLRDHMQRKTVKLSGLEFLILDEADRMLDMGFSDDVGAIISKTSRHRQTLLFSATFSEEVRKLAQKYLRNPSSIQATPQKMTAQSVKHILHRVDPERKLDLLFEVIHKHLDQQILIFARTKIKVDEVAKDLLSRGLEVMATHGDRTQAHRTKAMARFKDGRVKILVATDIAARGLDASDLGLVINYELPNAPEDYVHRIGRTGRAGKSGLAVSLVTHAEAKLLAAIERFIKTTITVVPFAGFEPKKSKVQVGSPEGKAQHRRTSKSTPPSKRHSRKKLPQKNGPGKVSSPRSRQGSKIK